MIATIGVKPGHSSILALKKELLFFDQIHLFGDRAAWSLAEILIPPDLKSDAATSVKNVLQEVDNLVNTGKTQNKLLEQVFTEYSILQEVGLVVDRSESEILKNTLENKEKYAQERKSDNPKADELHNMQYLLVLIDDALKDSNKFQPKLLKTIKKKDDVKKIQFENILRSKNVRSYIENENLLRELSGEILARLYSFVMCYDQSARYIPILDRLSDWKSTSEQDKNTANNKLQVINAVFKSLPMPSVATPLTEVLEFKKDSEARGHILALNNWIIDSQQRIYHPLKSSKKSNILFMNMINLSPLTN